MSGSKMFENFLFNYNMTFIKFTKSLIVRDRVREFLEKDPANRTDEDIEVLLDFMQHLPAFSNMTQSMRRALCALMVFVCVDVAGKVVHEDGELLKSWSVVLNGHLEVLLPDGSIQHLHMGDSFGIDPSSADSPVYHSGVLRTKVDDCQFVTVDQQHFFDILHQGKESITRIEENGEVVMVMEKRKLDEVRDGQLVLRGSAEKLIQHLVHHSAIADPTYIDDFLLTYRTFLKSASELTTQLVTWFLDPTYSEKAANIALRWVKSHPSDFDAGGDLSLWEFAEHFEGLLESHGTLSQLWQFCGARSAHSRRRTVVVSRTTRDEVLFFSVIGGLDKGGGVFVAKVEPGSKPYEAGLRRGDQILEVNNHNFERTTHSAGLQILRGNTHLAITVRSNVLGLRELKQYSDSSPHRVSRKDSTVPSPRHRPTSSDSGSVRSAFSSPLRHSHTLSKDQSGVSPTVQTSKIRRALLKFNLLSRTDSSDPQLNRIEQPSEDGSSRKGSTPSDSIVIGRQLYSSNPDLTSLNCDDADFGCQQDIPEHVIKVFRADQSFRYLLIHKETTAHEVVMLSLAEFGVSDASCNYSLCEVTFGDQGLVKTRHLPDQIDNLADRCSINSRYYLRNNSSLEALVPDDLVPNILRDATSFGSLLLLRSVSSAEIAIQLTRRDFSLFRSIEPAEYINDLFELGDNSSGFRSNAPRLARFSELVNEEMFWVATEVCNETNVIKRIRIIKQFIKIAKHCKTGRNFNSMFAILSGLGHGSVVRLKQTWEKLPSKYFKMFEEMQELMDPSRNMSKYRTMLNAHLCQTPVIPFFPLVKKDLTFIHFGNDSRVDGLVNFEKLRMIAKEVRQVTAMAQFESRASSISPTGTLHRMSASHESTLTRSGADRSIFYNTSASNGVLLSTPQRKKPTAAGTINAKKLFDEAQLSRRVRYYLSSQKVIDDEVKLSQLSQTCEPPARSSSKKADPSDCPSTPVSPDTQSTAVQGPLFGASSPDAVRKMMMLSDKVRTRDVKKKPNPSQLTPSSPLSVSVSALPRQLRTQPSSPRRTRPVSTVSPRQLNCRPSSAVALSLESSSVTSIGASCSILNLPSVANKPRSPVVSESIHDMARYSSVRRSNPQLIGGVVGTLVQSDSDSGRSSLASGDSHSNCSLTGADSSPTPSATRSAIVCRNHLPALPCDHAQLPIYLQQHSSSPKYLQQHASFTGVTQMNTRVFVRPSQPPSYSVALCRSYSQHPLVVNHQAHSRPVLPDYYTATKMLAEKRGHQHHHVQRHTRVRQRSRSCDELDGTPDSPQQHRRHYTNLPDHLEYDVSYDDEELVSAV